MIRSLLRPLAGLAVAGALAACAPMVDTRGNMPPADAIAGIQPGVTTRTQVSQLLGSPSSVGTFNDRTWYYIGRKTETVAFLQPEVTEQQVLVIKFDEAGVVQDFEKRGMETAREVAMNDRETPTAGHSLGFFEQLFGNIGRFSGKKDDKPQQGTTTTTTTSRGGY
ncbi:MAG: outer membrane protein assembly factor BamE [Alphaproteobacteria bacterium]|nr:outer membrane protein assembly factor BamE [Alphaproteobacteria bacterium]